MQAIHLKTLAHLIKYDTVHGKFDGTVEAFEDHLLVDGKMIRLLKQPRSKGIALDRFRC